MNATMTDTLQRRLTEITECFDAPCVVDGARIAQELLGRGSNVAAFTDELEFAELPSFRRWSIAQPVYVADEFDFVLMFAGDRRPAEVFAALRVLTHFHYDTPVVVVLATPGNARMVAGLERFDVVERACIDGISVLSNFELP